MPELNLVGGLIFLVGPGSTGLNFTPVVLQFTITSDGLLLLHHVTDGHYHSYVASPNYVTAEAKAIFKTANQMASLCLYFPAEEKAELVELLTELTTDAALVDYLDNPEKPDFVKMVFHQVRWE